MTRNAKARAELKNASHAMQEELNTDQEAYAAQAKLDALVCSPTGHLAELFTYVK